MSKLDAKTRDFFVTQVAKEIQKESNLSELEAVRSYIQSKTYGMLLDKETGLYQLSPGISFDMWKCEQKTGDPRDSKYISEEW